MIPLWSFKHSPLVSNTAASHMSSCIWKAFQGGSWIYRQLWHEVSKSPLSDANNNSCIQNPTPETQRPCCLQSRRTQHCWRGWGPFRFMCSLMQHLHCSLCACETRGAGGSTHPFGVVHGLQDGEVQHLQGGQNIFVVSHMVSEIVWENQEKHDGSMLM